MIYTIYRLILLLKCLFHWTRKVGEILLGGILEGLIIAWILVQFGVDKICIEVLQPFINQCELTTSHFYFVFGIVGFLTGCIYEVHK